MTLAESVAKDPADIFNGAFSRRHIGRAQLVYDCSQSKQMNGNWKGSTMNSVKIIKSLLANSGMSARDAGRRMGKTENYLFNIFQRNTDPRVSTFIKILEVFGCKLAVVNKSEKILYTVTKPEDDEIIG